MRPFYSQQINYMSRRTSSIATIAKIIMIVTVVMFIVSIGFTIYGLFHPEVIGGFFGKIVNGFNSAK